MADKNKSKAKKIITSLAAASAAIGGLFVYNYLNGNSPNEVVQLEEVQNIDYDDENYVINWDSVENADTYMVDINGDVEEVQECSYFYIPVTDTVTIKVMALDSTNTYTQSNWSEEFTYTVPDNEITIASVNAFVNDMLPSGYNLESVISMYVEDNYLYTRAVFGDELIKLETEYEENVESLKQAMEIEDQMAATRIVDKEEVVEYNSIDYLLKSNQYPDQLEEYRQQGYNISAITSQSYKMNYWGFGIETILKLDNGTDVKYFECDIICEVKDTPNKAIKYTTALENLDKDKIRINSFVELTGDFAEIAEQIDNQNSKSSYTQNTNDGMEY